MSLINGHTCQIERISTVHIKLFDGMIREQKDVRYVQEFDFGWNFESARPKRDSWRRRSQDVHWLIGSSEGHSTQ